MDKRKGLYKSGMRGHVRRFVAIGSALGTAIGATMMWLASNTIPDFIESADGHLAANLAWVGLPTQVGLASAAVDHFVYWMGGAVAFVSVLALFGTWIWSRVERAAVSVDLQQPKSRPPPKPQHDFEFNFPNESSGGIFAFNHVAGTAKFNVGGENHYIGQNAFGVNVQVPSWPRKPANETERREDLVSEILRQWTSLHQHDDPFPFPFPDKESLFATTEEFINAELGSGPIKGIPKAALI